MRGCKRSNIGFSPFEVREIHLEFVWGVGALPDRAESLVKGGFGIDRSSLVLSDGYTKFLATNAFVASTAVTSEPCWYTGFVVRL
jgi:hypothetical protein